MVSPQISIPEREIAAFCQRHSIRKLALFGSVLRDDFRPDSDVDVLVEFEPGKKPGFIGLGRMEEELSQLLSNRAIDLVTIKFLNPRIRNRVLAQAQVVYEQG
ncbi:MAG TPA: nucleotidyltransferase family protein [Phototrophicaceae bacterium]|nr:nucleotidyltransferase family protein [Phototrophicaceae bacterium]